MGLFEKIELGPLKDLDDITLDDMKKHPIWVNDLSGEFTDDHDESAERPVLSSKNVTKRMTSKYVSVAILIYCRELNMHGSANIEPNGSLSALVFWKDNKWQENNEFSKKNTIKVKCIPGIRGKDNLEFEYDIDTDQGILIT